MTVLCIAALLYLNATLPTESGGKRNGFNRLEVNGGIDTCGHAA